MNKKLQIRELALCALFCALTAVGAFLRIPVPFLDYFTLQFLFVILAGMLLGPRLGTIAVGIYVLAGLAGFPIFAAGGGPGYVLRPSFGYLLGFIGAAFLAGLVSRHVPRPRFRHYLLAGFAGMGCTYLIGFAYKYLILNLYLHQPTPLAVILLSAFPLDMPGDLLLCILGAGLAVRLRKILRTEAAPCLTK